MKAFKRHLVTAALPYANGPVHIGHLAGVYVPADIYTRYLRLKNEDVLYICGSDEHGVPITLKAKKEGVTPQDIVDRYHTIIKDSFEEFGIAFDIFSRTSNKTHHDTAADFFKTLYDKGVFEEKTTHQYYDEETKQFLADRYITGTCPKCGYEHAYGDQCEKCGSSLSATDLINPKSAVSGAKPVLKETKHWYLPLDKEQPFLENWILNENTHWRPNVYGQCKSWLDGGLEPRAVSRDLDWGVPVPVENAEGKVLYVWFDAPIGYISATKELTDDWETYWKQEDTHLVHFIGKDNIVFHCIIFPAMLKEHGNYILPHNVPANEFLNLENDKISTSRNWAVWLNEYLEDFPGKQDVLRYTLTSIAPETKDSDFTWKDFQSKNNNELLAILGNFVNRTAVLIQKYYDGKIPSLGTPDTFDTEVLDAITTTKNKIEQLIETFHFRDAQKELMNLFRLGNKYLTETEPWKLQKTNPEKTKTILHISAQLSANAGILMKPFLPFTAQKIEQIFNIELKQWDTITPHLLNENHLINKPFLLFEPIDDETIQKQIDKLEQTKQDNEEPSIEPIKETIAFDDFGKMDIRTATILKAEKVAKTKKLLKLELDTGIDQRTVVSGIAEYYKPEDIIGKQVVLLANLAPRKIRGIESHGMILMAKDKNDKLVFVTPAETINNGAGIS
jgi:methionyl-tRNA synthetase